MHKSRLSLDGSWRFTYWGLGTEPAETCQIQVPGPWQAQFQDLRMKGGVGLYEREVDLPGNPLEGWAAFLRFGAVFHQAAVWVNGEFVGGNEGGFLPFSFEVTKYLHAGSNLIVVRVESPNDDPASFPEAPFAEIPFGKQSWYGPLSGIWQSVFLEWRHPDHVDKLRIGSELNSGRVELTACFRQPLSAPVEVMAEIRDPAGLVVARALATAVSGDAGASFAMTVSDPAPWCCDEPNLYALEVTLRRDGTILDRHSETFGFRSFETRDGGFYLNGKRFHLRAALDQDYYPETICSVPSVAFLEDQFHKAKELGLNCLRLHIKAPDPRYYEVADRLGMLIWTELPNGGLSTARSRKRKEALLKSIVDRDGNHPCIVIWTIINENWGVDLVHDAEHRAWLKHTYDWLKAYDPSRLVVDNSPLAPSFHVATDIADYHFYAAIPDKRDSWDGFVEKLATRSDWLFSPEGDARRTGTEPRLCSEFGNWGLPHPADLSDSEGREPWWFETGHDWGDGVMYAHGVEHRFNDWSLDRVFGSLRGFVEAAQWQQFRALKYQIEAMRRRPELAGYVITELTDVHWEANGLLDMRRNPRAFHGLFRTINADTVIVPQLERRSYWSGEPIRVRIRIAHGAGDALPAGATLDVSLGKTSIITVPAIEAGTVVDLGRVELAAPAHERACVEQLLFELRGPDRTIWATNSIDVAVHPRPRAEPHRARAIWAPNAEHRAHLRALGYATVASLDEAEVVVASKTDAAITAFVRNGGALLLLPEAKVALQPLFPHWQNAKVVKRQDTAWQGDWASTFSWLRREGAFAAFPGGPLLDHTFGRVLPTHVIAGCNLLDHHARVHAGIVVGWIHKPAALMVERAYGAGLVVVSTFRLFRDPPGADPTATNLLEGMIEVALSRRRAAAVAGCEPQRLVEDALA